MPRQLWTIEALQAHGPFGRLTVIGEADPRRLPCGAARRLILCRCDCPEQTLCRVGLNELLGGVTRSCGCLHDRLAPEKARRAARERTRKGLMPPTDDGTLGNGIRERIFRRRVALRLTAAEAGKRAGLCENGWNGMERMGVTTPYLSTLLRVTLALDCDLADLLPDGWRDRLPPIIPRGKPRTRKF